MSCAGYCFLSPSPHKLLDDPGFKVFLTHIECVILKHMLIPSYTCLFSGFPAVYKTLVPNNGILNILGFPSHYFYLLSTCLYAVSN